MIMRLQNKYHLRYLFSKTLVYSSVKWVTESAGHAHIITDESIHRVNLRPV